MLKIDYHNIVGEMLTFPVVINRVGVLRAELQNVLSKKKFEVDIYRAKLSEMFRKGALTAETDTAGNKKIKNPTVAYIENKVLIDDGYQKKYKELINAQRNFDFLDSLYWSCNAKNSKIDKISSKLKPEDFEKDILEGEINHVIIKKHNKLIKD